VERLFAEVTERCVRRGSHTGVRVLEQAMLDYPGRVNARLTAPRPGLPRQSKVVSNCWLVSNTGMTSRST